MKQHIVNQSQNFIGGWYLQDDSVCDFLIEFHKHNPNKTKGQVGKISSSGNHNIVDESVKNSEDALLFEANEPLILNYMNNLQSVIDEYVKLYEFCSETSPWKVMQSPTIQRYPLGGAFNKWHCERSSTQMPSATRHLVFMTYLNDITDDGETEFYYQKIKVKPEKGLTLIWPSDWTHTHRGIPSMTQEKYIITGWFNFI